MFEKFAKKFIGLPTNEAIASGALNAVEAFFDVAKRLLRQREYMTGNEFGLGPLHNVPLVQRLFAFGYGDLLLQREVVSAW